MVRPFPALLAAFAAAPLLAQTPAPVVKAAEAITPEAIIHHIGVMAHDSMDGACVVDAECQLYWNSTVCG